VPTSASPRFRVVTTDATVKTSQSPSVPGAPKAPKGTESVRDEDDEMAALEAAWRKAYQKRRKTVLKNLPEIDE
jgi:hypothetical protein